MRLRIGGKFYSVKQSVRIRGQGIMLLLLGLLSWKIRVYETAIFFFFLGCLMLLPNVGKLNRFIYKAAKKVVRRGRDTYIIGREDKI